MAAVAALDGHLTTGQTARRLDVSAERVRQLLRAGALPFVKTPLGSLVPEQAVDAYAQTRRAGHKADGASQTAVGRS